MHFSRHEKKIIFNAFLHFLLRYNVSEIRFDNLWFSEHNVIKILNGSEYSIGVDTRIENMKTFLTDVSRKIISYLSI